MLKLPEGSILQLPVDQLGLLILQDLVEAKVQRETSYLSTTRDNCGLHHNGLRAIAEALGWLRARCLTARDYSWANDDAVMVTRLGHRVLSEGPVLVAVQERLQGLHPQIESEARPQFMIGKYELGVFASLKEVEIRVRQLGKFGADATGVDLMNKAFGPNGPLTDPNMVKGEQDGTRMMFAGAYAVLRNPSGHREVNYDDLIEAAEAVQTASLLMRMLDRVENRVQSTPSPGAATASSSSTPLSH